MNDSRPPREFGIVTSSELGEIVCEEVDVAQRIFDDEFDRGHLPNFYHVIEKSAYDEVRGLLNGLLNKVNLVTAAHRHCHVPDENDLDELSNRQIEVEQALRLHVGGNNHG